MKNPTILLFFLFYFGYGFSQQRSTNARAPIDPGNDQQQLNSIAFDYDAAGNQIKRYLIYISANRLANPDNPIKDIKEEDLVKADIYDDIKYYPNPVRETLYVEWSAIESNPVSQILIYNMAGQVLKSYTDVKANTNAIIDFQNYPQGFYTVQLVYGNGENKTLKVVKR